MTKKDASKLIFFAPIIIIFAKIIRYTVLKNSLVNMSMGLGWPKLMLSGKLEFLIGYQNSDASNNAAYILQIFKYLGAESFEDFEIFITIFWNIGLLILLFTSTNKGLSIWQQCFIYMSIGVLNIWDFCLAKEPIQMLYFVAIYCILILERLDINLKFPLCVSVIVLACITYRYYYILIALFIVYSFFILEKIIIKNKKSGFKNFMLVILLYGILYFVMMNVLKIISPEDFSVFMYFSNKVTTATTDMAGIFKSSNLIIITIDYLILVLRMLFPLELVRFGFQYALYAVYQIIISIYIVRAIINLKNNSKIKNYALYVYIGFLFGSATFEPDFGSWVRHEAVVLPIIFLIANINNFFEKGYVKNEK